MKHCSRCDQDKTLTDFGKHRGEPDGLQRWCRACRKENTANDSEWKAHKVAYDRQRRESRVEEFRAYNHDRYHNNPEYRARLLAWGKQRRSNPVFRASERQRHYRRWADPEYRQKKVASHRNRRHADPEYRRKTWHYRQVRRERIQTQGVPFTEAEWVILCARYDHCCLACGERKPLSVDHVVPISRGGSSDISNVQPLCLDCNRRKNARTIDYRT